MFKIIEESEEISGVIKDTKEKDQEELEIGIKIGEREDVSSSLKEKEEIKEEEEASATFRLPKPSQKLETQFTAQKRRHERQDIETEITIKKEREPAKPKYEEVSGVVTLAPEQHSEEVAVEATFKIQAEEEEETEIITEIFVSFPLCFTLMLKHTLLSRRRSGWRRHRSSRKRRGSFTYARERASVSWRGATTTGGWYASRPPRRRAT